MKTRSSLMVAAIVAAPLWLAAGDGGPRRVGATADGRSAAKGVCAGKPTVTLKKDWGQRFDAGRAGVSVSNGRAVTLVGQDDRDFAVAWDAATGRELWRVELGPTHPDQFGGP